MKCPACQNNNTRVVDSRPVDDVDQFGGEENVKNVVIVLQPLRK